MHVRSCCAKYTFSCRFRLICVHTGDIIISVETLDGETIVLEASPLSTIKSIKAKIEDKKRVPSDQQQLAFGEKRLQDECTLSTYGVWNGATLYLTLKLRGMYACAHSAT